ncbi:MAG: MFS transporter [Anaerolineae bacterium]
MAAATLPSKSTNREKWAWYFYDFGNSAYAAVVLLAVYSAYFKNAVVGGAEGSRLWGIAVGIAMLVVAVISPVLGTIADFSGSKKRFLFYFTALAVVFTGMLFFVQQGTVFIGVLFFVLAEIGYRASQVFYNALLPEIAHPDEMGRVSGNGWAFGSFGGIVCLLIVLAAIQLIGGSLVVRLSLVFTAMFFAASTVPLFLWLKERAKEQPLPRGESYISLAFKRLAETFREVKNYREFIKFIIAFLIYNDGILMTLDFAAILGAVLFGMGQQELIIFMIIVQITSVVGAYIFGLVADDWGGKLSLLIALVLMMIPVVWLYFSTSKLAFYFIGGLAGFALTGVQSVSRSVVGQMAPEGKSAEFYGFFSVAGRTSSFIGPTIFGLVVVWATRYYEGLGQAALLAEQNGHRLALFSILLFLAVGTILLLFVNVKRAREQAGNGPASVTE